MTGCINENKKVYNKKLILLHWKLLSDLLNYKYSYIIIKYK